MRLPAATRELAAAVTCGAWLTGPTASDAAIPLEEVIVTARKVAEPLQTVPVAIDVLDRERLVAGSVVDLAALARLVPGLYFEALWGGTGSAPVLRGQSQPSTAGDNVGLFVDGVYQAERTAIDVAPLDVERIEVVRGPQSALFGHATFSGAIHYVPRAPTQEFAYGVEVEAGSDDYWSAGGFVSGSLAGGPMLGRLAAGTRSASGTWSDSDRGASLGDYRRDAIAATLVTGGGPWAGRLSARWSSLRSSHPAESSVSAAQYNCGAIEPSSGTWSYYCGALPVARSISLSTGIPSSTSDVGQVLLSVTWNGAAFTFESDTSYYAGRSEAYRDFDATADGEIFGVCRPSETCPPPQNPPRPVLRLVQVNSISRQSPRTEEWSQEFRLHGSQDKLDWLVGITGFTTREDAASGFGFARGDLADDELLTVLLPLTPVFSGPIARANRALVDDPNQQQVVQARNETSRRTVALFGALTYRPVERVAMRAELRATRERLKLDSQVANFAPSFGKALPSQDFTDVTPRISLDFSPDADSLLYVSAAKGSRSGGINPIPALLPQEQGFDPEYNWTYELAGWLQDPARRWRGSATLYYIDWRDTQLLGFATTPGVSNLVTRNTAGVTTRGIELAGEARLHELLVAQAAYSYADPQFVRGSDDPGSSAFCGLAGGNTSSSFCTVGPARSGSVPPGTYVPYVDDNALQRAPRVQWQAGLRSNLPLLQSGWRPTAAVDLSYQSDVYDRAINGARYGERTLLSARAGLARGHWTIELWGTNLTDEVFVRAVSSRGPTFYPVAPRPLDLVYGEGRRIGLTLRYEQ